MHACTSSKERGAEHLFGHKRRKKNQQASVFIIALRLRTQVRVLVLSQQPVSLSFSFCLWYVMRLNGYSR